MISVPFAAALAASVLSTSFISGVFGMAGGMILMNFLLSMIPLVPAMALHGITQIASNGAWLWRQHVCWPVVARYAAGALVALAAMVLAPAMPGKPVALIFLGLSSLVGLGLPTRWAPDVMDNRQAVACGTLCNGLQLICGVCGPMLDLFFARRSRHKGDCRDQGCDQYRRTFHQARLFRPPAGRRRRRDFAGRHPSRDRSRAARNAAIEDPAWAIDNASFRHWSRRLIATIAAVSLTQGVTLQFWS